MTLENTGQAILIVGTIWLHLEYGLVWYFTLPLLLWGFANWILLTERDKRRRYFDARIRLIEARARYYERMVSER